MKKLLSLTLVLLLTSLANISNSYALSTVCLEAKNDSMQSGDFLIYTLVADDKGDNIYSLTGYVTTFVKSIALTMKSLTNGSGAIFDNKVEVSLAVRDIQDFPGSTTVEALMLGETG